MSDYELLYNATDPDREPGWYWRMPCGWADAQGKSGMGWIESGPFSTIDEARADAESELAEDGGR